MVTGPSPVEAAATLAATGHWDEAADTVLPLLGDPELLRSVLPSLVTWVANAGRPLASIVEAVPPDQAKLLLAGLGTLAPGHAAELLEACFAAGWPQTTVLAASTGVAPSLPVDQALLWSGRLRAAGFGTSCPLVGIATGPRHPAERAVAAAVAHQAFADPRALPAFAAALDCAPAWRRTTITTQAERLCPGIVAASPPPTPLPPARVTVVIPCLDHVDLTVRCLDALERRTDPRLYELVVVDNASTDGTRDLASLEAGAGGRFRYLRNEENLGFGMACNQGAAAGQGELVLFLNNDTEVGAGWLDPLLAAVDGDPEIGAVQPLLLFPDGRVNDAGGLVLAGGQAWVYGKGHPSPGAPQFSCRRDVDYASGACLLVRRSAFEAVGGFDDRYAPAYYEDVDLSFALRAAGWRAAYEPASRVVHVEGGTAGTDTGSGLKQYQVRNAERFATKWASELSGRPEPHPAVAERWAHRPGRPGGLSVLVVDPTVPAHDQSAGGQRLFTMLRCLRTAGHAVTFLGVVPGDARYVHELAASGVHCWDGDSVRILGPRQAPAGDPRPAFEDLLTTYAFDAVLLSPWDIAELLGERVRTALPEALVVVDSVDLHFVRMERLVEVGGEGASPELAREVRRRELAAYAAADRVVCVTAEEASLVAELLPGADVAVLPVVHGDTDPGPGFGGRSGVVFVGNFNHTPNVDALDWWQETIAPRLASLLPGVPLTVVGHDPQGIAAGHADECTVVTGSVPAVLPYLHRARVSVAPLRYGAGMKGKVGEALAAGTPVVTTSTGSEGMDLVDGEHVLCADDPAAFAAAVARLHGDEALWAHLSDAGRAHARRRFGIDRMQRDLDRVLAPARPDRRDARLRHARAEVLRNREQLRQLEDHARLLATQGDHDGVLRVASAAAQWAWFDHPGAFVSPVLEQAIAEVGRHVVAGLPAWSPGPGRRRVLHVLTQAYSLGGHTRLAWRWMEQDPTSDHAVVLTDQRGHPVPDELAAAGPLTLLSGPTPVDRVRELAVLLASADLAVLHLHPSDAVAVAAAADPDRRPPTVLLDHADHVFWLGVGAADAVAHLRPLGAELTTARRGVPAERCLELPLPLDDRRRGQPRDKAKVDLGVPPQAVVLATMASAYKYTPVGRPTFCQLAGEVLTRVDGCHLVAVGPDVGLPDWARLAQAHPGRVHLLGSVGNPWPVLEAADVYLDSFPFSSLTSLLETALLGVPAVTLAVPGARGPLGADDFDATLVTPGDGPAWVEAVVGLATDEPARTAAGERLAAEVRRSHLGSGWSDALAAVVAGVRHGTARVPTEPDQAVGPMDEVLWLLHRQAGITRSLGEVLAEYGVQPA